MKGGFSLIAGVSVPCVFWGGGKGGSSGRGSAVAARWELGHPWLPTQTRTESAAWGCPGPAQHWGRGAGFKDAEAVTGIDFWLI